MSAAPKFTPESAYEAFYKSWRGQTPANAIRLAISDHVGYNKGSGINEFLYALRLAERQVEAQPDLVAALEAVDKFITRALAEGVDADDYFALRDIARAALAKVSP